jgi:uncharacterized membrane protein YukC
MQENLKDILSNLSTEVDQETLLLYLQGKLSAEQQHEVEKKMMDNEFASDAIEGLQNFKDQQRLQSLVDQLNKDLRKKSDKKKARLEKRKLTLDPWMIITIILILALIVISYFIIHRYTTG